MLLLAIVFLVILFSQNRDENKIKRGAAFALHQKQKENKKPKQNASASKVEMKRFELSTLRMRTVRSSQLSYTPEQMIL